LLTEKEFSGKYLSITLENKLAFIEMNRPPANALDIPTVRELRNAVETVSEDPNIHVAIITSANNKIFCGGADISTVEDHDPNGMDLLGKVIKDLFLAMRGSSKVFIAEIGGHCLGGGLELALACDFRFAAKGNMKFGLPEVNLGLFPGGGGIQMAGRIIGQQKAFELAATGNLISVEEASQIGLVDHLHSPEELREEVLKFANKIAQGPMIAISNMKQAVYRGLAMGIEQAFDFERQMHKHLVATDDCKEGVVAFRARRAPQFQGK
jgi:enoyl-CoA hydratase/carnithine racemase